MKTGIKVLLVLFVVFNTTFLSAERFPTQRGHWSPPQPMDRPAWNVFRAVMDERTDNVKYTPTSYSIQLVNGKRYRFYCRSTVSDTPKSGSALITVFVHLGGEVELASLQDTTAATGKNTNAKKPVSSAGETGPTQWLPEPLYPRTGPHLQPPRITVRRL